MHTYLVDLYYNLICSAGSQSAPGSCPLRGGPLELGLVSVSKLQVRLVRVVGFTMLESLGVCLIYGFMSTRKLRLSSQAQIETPLLVQLYPYELQIAVKVPPFEPSVSCNYARCIIACLLFAWTNFHVSFAIAAPTHANEYK